ncbi:oligosaccharide flippase family protein [Chitinophaga pollutisoli]|uniref:Oligosaccharide flippase family protein n=1 Tax=Chitinophaga pollutisoli TaxID=3133966 RepID=A0ABZ2YV36_9BACT
MASDKVSKIIIVFMGQMFNLLLLFLLTPYLSRSLSKHEFGTFSQVQLLSTLIVAIFSLGLSRIFYLVIEKREFEKKDAFKTIMFMAFILGLAGSIASFFSSPLWAILLKNPYIQLPLTIYAPFFLLNSLNLLLELTLIHKGLIRRDMTIIIASNILKLGLLLLSIQIWRSFTFIFWIIGTIAPLAQTIMYLFSIPLREFFEGTLRKHIYKFIIKIGLPLGVTGVLAASYTYLAGFFVSNMFNTEDFAIYRNGSFEIPFLGIIATSVASILTPQFANLLAEGKREEVARLKTLSISEVAAISYPIIFVILFLQKTWLCCTSLKSM